MPPKEPAAKQVAVESVGTPVGQTAEEPPFQGRLVVAILFALLALSVFAGALGTFSPVSRRLLGLCAVLAIVIVPLGRARLRWVLAAAAALIWIALKVEGAGYWCAAAAGLVALLSAQTTSRRLGMGLRAAATGILLFGALLLALDIHPFLWNALAGFSVRLSRAVTTLAGNPLALGPSASGVWILVAYSAVCCGFLLHAKGREDVALVLVCASAGVVALFAHLAYFVHEWPGWVAAAADMVDPAASDGAAMNAAVVGFHATSMYLALLALPCALLARPMLHAPMADKAGVKAHATWWIVLPAGLGALVGFFSHPAGPSVPPSGQRVLLHNDGMLDWRVPTPGVFGVQRGGMFGLLPRYLDAAGYDVRRLAASDQVDAQALREVDVFVVINPAENALASVEIEAIRQFVEQGGGLLALGDHTDLGGMMAPLNKLLDPFGIAYRFDSAYRVSRWRGDYDAFPGPATRRLGWANEVLQQGTGASLAVEAPAYPLVAARYAFSDAGVRENEANGYLGDYRYQLGEQLGGLVVVAGAEHGSGRVVVFGDTSAFQNVAMPHSAPFIVDVVDCLATDCAPLDGAYRLAAAVCLAALLCLLAIRRWPPLELAAGAGALALGAALAGWLANTEFRFEHPRLALVEATQANRFTLRHWERESVDGLFNNLGRAGYLPLVMDDDAAPHLDKAALLVSVAPQKPHASRRVERIHSFVHGGGTLLLAVGWEERAGALPLLGRFGYELDARPLGPVPILPKTTDQQVIAAMRQRPQFHEAWGIAGAFDDVLVEAYTLPIVGARRVGSGEIVLIGDSYFLLDRALESENSWWQGNVDLVQRILGRSARAEAREDAP